MPSFPTSKGATLRLPLTAANLAKQIAAFRSDRSSGLRLVIADERSPGLRIVIGRRTATWTYNYRPRGTDELGKRRPQRTLTLGDAETVSIDDARESVARARRAVAAGNDPLEDRRAAAANRSQEARDAARSAEAQAAMLAAILAPTEDRKKRVTLDFSALADATLGQCARAYVVHAAGGNASTVTGAEIHLRLALDEMHATDLKPADLKRSAVARLVRMHRDRPATARHRLGVIRRLYHWLAANEAVEVNPAVYEKAPPPPPKTRVWTADEVQRIWISADRLPNARRAFVRLITLLPLRRAELANTRVRDIRSNGPRLELVIEAGRAKNRVEHIMPLTGEARAIVERLMRDRKPVDYLLKLTDTGRPFDAWKAFARSVRKVSGVSDFAFHDCRRTFSSECGEHGLEDDAVVDAALNHGRSGSRTGASRHYNHAKKLAARTRLLAAWGQLVEHAARTGCWPRDNPDDTDTNVIPIVIGK